MMFKFSNPGSRMKPVRKSILKDGKLVVAEVGKEDLQEYIESFGDQCNIENIVMRAAAGQPELLNQRQGQYGDFSQFPTNYAEVLQRVIDATAFFESLPSDVRGRFENDVYKFIGSMDEKDFFEKAGFISPEPVAEDKESKE